MGHFLATVNPEAVDRIGGEPATLPGIGDWVIYIGRPGEGRRAKQEFPALVMGDAEPGTDALTLVVVYDADDVIYLERIPMQAGDHQYPAWRSRKPVLPASYGPETMDGMRSALAEMGKRVETLLNDIYGTFHKPPKSIMEYMAGFEQKLRGFDADQPKKKASGRGK